MRYFIFEWIKFKTKVAYVRGTYVCLKKKKKNSKTKSILFDSFLSWVHRQEAIMFSRMTSLHRKAFWDSIFTWQHIAVIFLQRERKRVKPNLNKTQFLILAPLVSSGLLCKFFRSRNFFAFSFAGGTYILNAMDLPVKVLQWVIGSHMGSLVFLFSFS